MRCVSWNVRGLRHPHRRGVVGRYLKEWGVEVICLHETLLIDTDHRIWSDLGWGCKDSQVCINATGRSGGVMVAWKEISFDKLAEWRGRHVVAAHLLRWADGIHLVFASAYGPTIPTVRGELWEDLIQLCGAFPNLPTLIGGDFNVTLAAADRPNDAGGRDPGSARFKEVLAQLGLGEMGPTDKRFTWSGPHLSPGSIVSFTHLSSSTSTPWRR